MFLSRTVEEKAWPENSDGKKVGVLFCGRISRFRRRFRNEKLFPRKAPHFFCLLPKTRLARGLGKWNFPFSGRLEKSLEKKNFRRWTFCLIQFVRPLCFTRLSSYFSVTGNWRKSWFFESNNFFFFFLKGLLFFDFLVLAFFQSRCGLRLIFIQMELTFCNNAPMST